MPLGARTKNAEATFNLPIRYIFSPSPTRWSAGIAHVEGWAKNEITTLLGDKTNMVDVTVESGAAVFRAEMPLESLPPDLLAPDANRANTPDVGGRHFQVLICPSDSLPNWPFAVDNSSPKPQDAWTMRDEFFDLKEQDFAGLHAFLQKWGALESTQGHKPIRSVTAKPYLLVTPYFVWQMQSELRKVVVGSIEDWLHTRPRALPPWNTSDLVCYAVTRHDIAGAVTDTITIDKMLKHEHAVCALDGCERVFAKSTKHKREYCTETHALRARQREYARKRKVAKAPLSASSRPGRTKKPASGQTPR